MLSSIMSLRPAALTPARIAAAFMALAAALPAVPSRAADDLVGRMGTYRTVYEDTLVALARRFGLGYVELVAANPGVDPWLPGAGTEIVLPTAHLLPDAPRRGVVINLTEMRLYHFDGSGRVQATYPIGIGRDNRMTPLGRTRIARKVADPTWYPPAWLRAERPGLPAAVPPGENNPLGRFALYLGWPRYLVHGTHRPYGVGRRVSAGCIRLYPEHIERLYAAVPVGTPVTVVDQPVKFGWIDGELYVEVHPSKAQADELEAEGRFTPELPPQLVRKATAAAGPQAERLDVPATLRAGRERRGYPVRITR